jgi:hypothetical protein
MFYAQFTLLSGIFSRSSKADKPICFSREGSAEAPALFSLRLKGLQHPDCVHRGGAGQGAGLCGRTGAGG